MDHENTSSGVKSYIKTPTKDMEQQLNDFCSLCTYISGQYDQTSPSYSSDTTSRSLESGRKETNRIFYMAYHPASSPLSHSISTKNCYLRNGIARIIVRLLPMF